MMDISKEDMEGIKKLLDQIHEADLELTVLKSKVKIQNTKRDSAIADLDRVRDDIDYGNGPLFEKQEEAEDIEKSEGGTLPAIGVIEVEASRLEDDGDIRASHSAATIPEGKVRKPFKHEGIEYVAVGGVGTGKDGMYEMEAYGIIPAEEFEGKWYRYDDADFEVLRNQPEGFYHGLQVYYRRKQYALVGPPVKFVPKGAVEEAPGEPVAAGAPAAEHDVG